MNTMAYWIGDVLPYWMGGYVVVHGMQMWWLTYKIGDAVAYKIGGVVAYI